MKPWTPYPLTCQNGLPIHPGDIMQYNRHGAHLRNLRDGYLNEGQPERRALKKQWYDDALAERFIVIETGHNGHAPGILYRKVNSEVIGECIAGYLERADSL